MQNKDSSRPTAADTPDVAINAVVSGIQRADSLTSDDRQNTTPRIPNTALAVQIVIHKTLKT